MPDALIPLLALVAGLALGLWLGRKGAADAKAAGQRELEAAARERDELRREREETRGQARVELEALQTELKRVQEESALARAELAAAEARREEQENAHLEAEKRTVETFRSTAAKVLQESTTQFLELAKSKLEISEKHGAAELEQRKQAIEALVKPLTEKLKAVGESTQQLEAKREKAYGEIQAQFTQLASTTAELHKSSHALTEALRGSSQARGRWGEMALRNVAELAGMTEHCDFSLQVTDADGQRPDMVVKLPGGGAIPVDAKAPFTDYQKASETSDPAERERFLAQHAVALRTRVRELAKKDYAKSLDAKIDYVVMFVPAEPVLAAAFQKNPDLQVEALRDRVLIATPVTLVALLRTVGIYWSQEKIALNAQEAMNVAQEFYKRVTVFTDHLIRVGRGLDGAVSAYNKAMGSFESRVLVEGRKLEELGLPEAVKRVSSPPVIESGVREPTPTVFQLTAESSEADLDTEQGPEKDAGPEEEQGAGA